MVSRRFCTRRTGPICESGPRFYDGVYSPIASNRLILQNTVTKANLGILLPCCFIPECVPLLASTISSARDEKNTGTHLVNTSPTKIKKNVGDTKGAKITCRIAIHSGLLNFHGKIKHFMVYMIKMNGYVPGGTIWGKSPAPACEEIIVLVMFIDM